MKYFVSLTAFFLCLASFQTAKGQEVAFSQFYASPLYLNPAMTGLTYSPRFTLNYRNQWASFNNAFQTYAVSYDQHFDKFNSGIGISVLADRAMQNVYNHNKVALYYSYLLNVNRKLAMKFGAEVAFVQKSVRWNELIFLDQIDPLAGVQSPDTPSQENLPAESNFMYPDFSAGVLVFTGDFYGGVSVKHLTRPHITINDFDPDSRLLLYSSVHAGKVFTFNTVRQFDPFIAPNILYANQELYNQITVGSTFGVRPVYSGIYARHTINNFDALILLLGVRRGGFRAAYSVDFSVGQSTKFNGASHEVSISIELYESGSSRSGRRNRSMMTCPDVFQ